MTLKQILEAVLFASEKPLPTRTLLSILKSAREADADNQDAAAFAKLKEVQVYAALDEMRSENTKHERGFHFAETAGGWQVVSNPDCGLWVRQLFPEMKPSRLSPPAMETLAIVAYRQPITKADIEAIRGVAVDGVLQTLLDRGLVRIAGRAEIPGRPLIYETTQFFMEHFALKSLDELPNADELRKAQLPTAESKAAPAEEPATAELPLDPADSADSAQSTGSSESSGSSEPSESSGSTESSESDEPSEEEPPT